MPRLCGTPGQTDDVALAITALHLQGARRMGTHLINQNWCAGAVCPPTQAETSDKLFLCLEERATRATSTSDSLMQLLFPHWLFCYLDVTATGSETRVLEMQH